MKKKVTVSRAKTLPQAPVKKDFFTSYQNSKMRSLAVAGFFSLCCAFAIVASYKMPEITGKSLMASIASLTEAEVQYPADLVFVQKNGTIEVVFGANASHVDTVEWFILLNPDEGVELSGNEHIELTQEDMGMYRFVLHTHGKSLQKGQTGAVILTNVDRIEHISATDTEFTSGAERYRLSNIVE